MKIESLTAARRLEGIRYLLFELLMMNVQNRKFRGRQETAVQNRKTFWFSHFESLMDFSRLQKLFGVGPLGAVISLVLLTIAVWVDRVFGHSAISANPAPVRVIGGGLAIIGLGLLFWSVWTLRIWWAKEKLCTRGPFKWFRHPVYAAWITFILPAAALYLNSWIILFVVVLIHPIWHRLVLQEEKMMFEKFQNEYREYAARTGRFFPRIWNR